MEFTYGTYSTLVKTLKNACLVLFEIYCIIC